MDRPVSPEIRRRRRRRRWLAVAASVGLLGLVMVGLAKLKPAAPRVDKSSIWMDTVKRGEMLRQVRGNGTLVPENIRWIPTVNAGRVERIVVLPGAAVKADTVLVELSNPEVAQAAFDAEWELKAAEAGLTNLQVQLSTQNLTQQAAVANARANHRAAKMDFEVNEELAKAGLVPALTLKQAKARVEELDHLYELEKERLALNSDGAKAQLAAQVANTEQLRAKLDLRRRQLDALKVRAGMDGVLQRLGNLENPLQIGQQLAAGALVARVADPTRLKAEIRIAETQAKDIQLDQPASVDTRNGVINGRVTRIDPAVQNGTVMVDVALEGALPKGARPDLSVDGTIQLERLQDVMYLGRPVQGQPESTVGLFRVTDNGRTAVRISVKLGRSSVSTIEITGGLEVGDQVILSDMSQWDSHDRVRLQ